MTKTHRRLLTVLLALVPLGSFGQAVTARWALDSNTAATGQSLTLTLEIQGTDQFSPPTLTVPGVDITFTGGGPQNSSSTVSINGSTTTTVEKAWAGTWGLTASRAGRYHLDPPRLSAGGSALHLPALDWTVSDAPSSAKFFLWQEIVPQTAVVGVEVNYRLVWYIGESVKDPHFALPILDDPNVVPVDSSFADPATSDFQIQHNGRTLGLTKSQAVVGGKTYTTLTLTFRVKTLKPGTVDLSGTAVSFSGVVGTQPSQDFFGNETQDPVYSQLQAKAAPLRLTIRDIPTAGRPHPFSGLVGNLKLSWEGGQGPYHVGEPIQLKLKLDGVLNKPNLDLDQMVAQALSSQDFQVDGNSSLEDPPNQRSFLFRARHPGTLSIPPLTLNFYDPERRQFGQTASQPLSFTILPSGPVAASPATSIAVLPLASEGAAMNPIRLSVPGSSLPPWWVFGVPGLVLGILLGALGLWVHSRRRRLERERRLWRRALTPLNVTGRPSLEAGRQRLKTLLQAGETWKAQLQASDRWPRLEQEQREWEQAFFDDKRDDEPWTARWNVLCQEMEEWK